MVGLGESFYRQMWPAPGGEPSDPPDSLRARGQGLLPWRVFQATLRACLGKTGGRGIASVASGTLWDPCSEWEEGD